MQLLQEKHTSSVPGKAHPEAKRPIPAYPEFSIRSWKMPEIFALGFRQKQSANLRSFWQDTMFFGLLEKKIEWFAEQKLQMSKWKPQGII